MLKATLTRGAAAVASAGALAAAGVLAQPPQAAAVPPTEMVGHVANYMNGMGFHVSPPAVQYVLDGTSYSYTDPYGVSRQSILNAKAAAVPAKVVWNSNHWAALVNTSERYGTRGRLDDRQLVTLKAVVHEIAHQRGFRGWWSPKHYRTVAGQTMGWWEEGIADAAATDAFKYVAAGLFGHAVTRDWTSYTDRVRNVRQLSVFATWPGTWTDTEATAWRSRLLMRDYTDREAMLKFAYAERERVYG